MKKIIYVFAACIISFSAAAQLSIQSGATLYLSGNARIVLQDINLVNDGTITVAANGRFSFTGSVDNSISGSQQPAFNELEIAKTGTSKLILQRAINVNGKIVFTSGLIDLNNNNINLGNTAFLETENENSRVIGSNGGQLIFTTTLNAPATANPGNLGAIITSSQNLGVVTISRGHKSQINGYGNGNSVLRYYDINPANNTGLNATLRFQYFDAELNGLVENGLLFWKSSNNSNWTNQGFTSRNTTGNYVEKTGITDFSRWTLSSLTNPLPVRFLLFNIHCTGNSVLISWKTAQEQNTARFSIERSADGIRWTAIGSLPAAGNSTTERSYSYNDNSPVAGGAMYRIAEYDMDGRIQYTSIIRSDCEAKDNWKLWPNPVQEMLWVHITTTSASSATIKVFNSKGSLIRSQQNALLPGSNQLNVDMKRLAAGTYHVTVDWGNGQTQKSVKIIKM
ncbi:MAG TPA: T9SS type A sorting domain-containing protein [Chitinophagaceae bacterium]|nr:T9SS type A sorting domain-containing protein [Chitinophagaceae bacterium]